MPLAQDAAMGGLAALLAHMRAVSSILAILQMPPALLKHATSATAF